ncbi:MAG: hypothetical protein QF721_02040 [Verrucomicrobiota bacterium]|nr:hypothetical protein [Verrucomicrobiota bacterium]MDP7048209.1 hypothetical protein [Verrucomicrobiota bacterium]
MADPDSQSLLLQATERAESGDFAQAAELSRQLLSRNEADVDALFLLGRNDEAIKALEKAVQISNSPDMLVQLRENLRGVLERSPLMDYDGYAREFSGILQLWWAKRCAAEN